MGVFKEIAFNLNFKSYGKQFFLFINFREIFGNFLHGFYKIDFFSKKINFKYFYYHKLKRLLKRIKNQGIRLMKFYIKYIFRRFTSKNIFIDKPYKKNI